MRRSTRGRSGRRCSAARAIPIRRRRCSGRRSPFRSPSRRGRSSGRATPGGGRGPAPGRRGRAGGPARGCSARRADVRVVDRAGRSRSRRGDRRSAVVAALHLAQPRSDGRSRAPRRRGRLSRPRLDGRCAGPRAAPSRHAQRLRPPARPGRHAAGVRAEPLVGRPGVDPRAGSVVARSREGDLATRRRARRHRARRRRDRRLEPRRPSARPGAGVARRPTGRRGGRRRARARAGGRRHPRGGGRADRARARRGGGARRTPDRLGAGRRRPDRGGSGARVPARRSDQRDGERGLSDHPGHQAGSRAPNVTPSGSSATLRAMPGIDLHTHSVRSDGTNTVSENVALAVERGLAGIAITDHDTTAGAEEAGAAAAGTDLRIVPGIEFSAEHDGASLHVLAYWIAPADADLVAELRRLTDTRFRRGELMVENLQALGYDISFERVREIAGDDLVARPHIAQAMVEAGIVETEKDAFDRFISDGGPAYVPKHALAPLDALALIRGAGGVCVLAHPAMWKGNGSVPDALIDEMAAGGMGGLEVDHPDHDPVQRAHYRALAERLDLVPTGASDCHGARYDYRLSAETTPLELVDELHARTPG